MKLLIQNKGIAPIEAFTLLGASLSRDDASLIGQFGSGAKLAITTLLRAGLGVTIFCGKTRLDFKTKPITISDGIVEKEEQQVFVQFGGTSKKKLDLGWTLGMGALDWRNTDMAIREFVANAIDRTIKQGTTVKDAYTDCDLIIDIVRDERVRAQDGYTRVFIDANKSLAEYVDNLDKHFLHFTSVPISQQILPKTEKGKSRIYLEGVFVCELKDSAEALCDYNFRKGQIEIDESRNLNEYVVRAAIGRLYKDADVPDLVRVFTALERGEACLETGLDAYYMKSSSWETGKDLRAARWKAAWEQVNGQAVICGQDQGVLADFARRKGHIISSVQSISWLDTIKDYGVRSVNSVVSENELRGRKITPPTFEAIDAIREVWGWVDATDLMPVGLKLPRIQGFDCIMQAESDTLGFYEDGTVFIRNDLGGDLLYETALEEIAHYITKADDCSRDFQTFFMRLLVRWMRK